MYCFYLYFLGLSKNVSKILIILEMRREATCMYGTGLRCKSCQFYRRKRNSVFIIDETMIQTGCKDVWILIAIEPVHKCNSAPHL